MARRPVNYGRPGDRSYRASGLHILYTPEQVTGLQLRPSHGRFRASGKEPFRPVDRMGMWHYDAIAAAVERRMTDVRNRAGELSVEEIAAGYSPSAQSAPQATVRRTNNRVKSVLSTKYEGVEPRSRLKGKGRSVDIGDVYKPSLEHAFGEDASRRIGSLTGSTRSPRQSGATMLSNFGANKNLDEGLLGASSSRLRGAQNMMARPGTWMNRFAAYWLASEVAKGYADWQGWDRVSFGMSRAEAKQAIGDTRSLKDLPAFLGGKLTAATHHILKPFLDLGIAVGSGIRGLSNEEAALASAWADAYASWAGKGFRGPNPEKAVKTAQGSAMFNTNMVVQQAQKEAEREFNTRLLDNIARSKDSLAERGAGGVLTMNHMFRSRPEYQQAVSEVRQGAANKIDYKAMYESHFNRAMKDYKG